MKGEKVMENKQLIMDYNDKPSKGKWITLSFQHVFAMFSATVLVPILTGLPISIALFSSGIGTLIYILCTKGKVPMYLGSSFAYIAYINSVLYMIKDNGEVEVDEFGNRILNADGGRGALIAGVVAIGIVYCLVAILIKIIGTNNNIFTTNLDTVVDCFNSSFNFILSNKVFLPAVFINLDSFVWIN